MNQAARVGALAGLALLAAACAARPEPPSPDRIQPPPPSLAGRAVLVLPVQATSGPQVQPAPGLDADIAFFLAERAPAVHWVFPAAIERAVQNAPTLRIRPRELAVSALRGARLERIGEPLFGELHSLGVLFDARLALVPYAGGYVRAAGAAAGRVELGVAIIDTSDGDVLWLGAIAGEPGPPDAAAVTASAASALAALLAR